MYIVLPDDDECTVKKFHGRVYEYSVHQDPHCSVGIAEIVYRNTLRGTYPVRFSYIFSHCSIRFLQPHSRFSLQKQIECRI